MDLVERDCYRCGGGAFEELDDDGLLACVWCGARERLARPRRPKAVPAANRDAFRFKFGRYADKTFAEVDAEPNGRRYLEWMRDTNERLRDVVGEYLDHAPPCAEAALVAASAATPGEASIPGCSVAASPPASRSGNPGPGGAKAAPAPGQAAP